MSRGFTGSAWIISGGGSQVRVLVTGGTGFVGREVVRHLHDRGHEVHLLARDPSRAARLFEGFPVRIHKGNILEPATLSAPVQDVDAVIHLVGIISESGSHTFQKIHVSAVQNLLEAIAGRSPLRLIHMSALGTRPQARARYHQTKWEGEQLVRQSRLPWTIFRPSIIYGPGDLFVNRLALAARRFRLIPVIGDGKTRLQPVQVGQVGRALVSALTNPETIRRSYDLAGPEKLSFNEIAAIIQRVVGVKAWQCHLRLPAARAAAWSFEKIGALLRIPPPLTRDQLIMLQEDNTGDPLPAERMLGLPAAPSFEEGIASFLQTAKRAKA